MDLSTDPLARVLDGAAAYLAARGDSWKKPATGLLAHADVFWKTAVRAAVRPGWKAPAALLRAAGEARRDGRTGDADLILWRLRNSPGQEPCPRCLEDPAVPIGDVGAALAPGSGLCRAHDHGITVELRWKASVA